MVTDRPYDLKKLLGVSVVKIAAYGKHLETLLTALTRAKAPKARLFELPAVLALEVASSQLPAAEQRHDVECLENRVTLLRLQLSPAIIP